MYKSMKVKEKTLRMLRKLKIHPRQSYDEVIENLVKGRENVGRKSSM